MGSIAMQEIARTNQNPKDGWRREAALLIFWVLCPKTYIAIALYQNWRQLTDH
jgi:hypothetical protein